MATPAHVTAAEAAALVSDSDSIGVPLGPGVPGGFLHALGERERFDALDIFGALMPDLYEVLNRSGVRYRSGFYGPAERFWLAAGANIEFVPADFRRFAPLLEHIAPRIVATAASMPDADGNMSLSLHAGASVTALHQAAADPDRVCLVEVSPHFPRTYGVGPDHSHSLSVDQVDVIVETDRRPFELDEAPPNDIQRAIAEHAAGFVPDGATLQTGIGGIPNAVASLLADGPGGGYGIHSEMFTTGLMKLCQAGKVTNDHKGLHDGYSVTTFAAGNAELYEWLHENESVRFLPVDVVNSPEAIAHNAEMITINGAIAVDLAGQVIADNVDGRQFSGVGGHEDFIAAAGMELSDRSLVCLPSTSRPSSGPKAGELVSRILPMAPTGTVITTPRHQLDVVITEHGVADLFGLTVRERARALAQIGHPDVRDELLASAEIWPDDG